MDAKRRMLLTTIKDNGFNLKTLSAAIGKSPSFLHQYIHYDRPIELRERDREKIEDYLGLPRDSLKFRDDPGSDSSSLSKSLDNDKPDKRVSGAENIQPNVDLRRAIRLEKPISGTRRDLPIYSSAAAGEGFVITTNEPIDWSDRPPYLIGVTEAFGFILFGDSMYPRYEHGEILIVHPRPPLRGKDALVILSNADHEMVALAKTYIETKKGKVYLKQYNPEQVIEIDESKVIKMCSITGPAPR